MCRFVVSIYERSRLYNILLSNKKLIWPNKEVLSFDYVIIQRVMDDFLLVWLFMSFFPFCMSTHWPMDQSIQFWRENMVCGFAWPHWCLLCCCVIMISTTSINS